MARKLNLVTPDLGAPDADFVDGFYLDEDAGVPGTPILADEKTSIYYFFSRLMDRAGLAFSGVVDSFTTSQFFDAFLVAAQKPETETVSVSSTLTLNSAYKIFYIDTSGGNKSITVPAPDFIGHPIDIICDGTGYVDVTFTGQESTAPVRVTNGKKLSLKGKSGGDWIADSGKTAVYTSGAFRVIQYSDGEMEQEASVDSQVTIAVNNFFGTSSGTVYYADSGLSYAVPFLAAPAVYSGQQDSIASHYYNKTTTTITLRVFGNSNGGFQKSFYVSRGRY